MTCIGGRRYLTCGVNPRRARRGCCRGTSGFHPIVRQIAKAFSRSVLTY